MRWLQCLSELCGRLARSAGIPARPDSSYPSCWIELHRGGLLCAQVDGFDLHGRLAFSPTQRRRLEQLVQYCARPSLANDRLQSLPDGKLLLELKTHWRDGTTHLKFEPIELMERLAAQIPKPYVNLVLYAGVLAPNAKFRKHVVAYARPPAVHAPDGDSSGAQTRAELVIDEGRRSARGRLAFGNCADGGDLRVEFEFDCRYQTASDAGLVARESPEPYL